MVPVVRNGEGRMTPSDYAFLTFLGTSNRGRMSPDEQRLFDFYNGHPDANPAVEEQIQQYAKKKRKQA